MAANPELDAHFTVTGIISPMKSEHVCFTDEECELRDGRELLRVTSCVLLDVLPGDAVSVTSLMVFQGCW